MGKFEESRGGVYRKLGTHQRSFERYHTRYNQPALPRDWGSQPPPKISIAIISGTGKATDFKFGWYIQRAHPNKSPLKIWEKRERGHCSVFKYRPIISRTGKATNFKFCTHIHRIDRNKIPLKISGKVAVGVLRDSRKFSGHPYIGRIARSSLR